MLLNEFLFTIFEFPNLKYNLMNFKYTLLFLTFFPLLTEAQTICNSGNAGGYPCSNIDFYSRLSISQLGGTSSAEVNDIWGWTDPLDNKEYAIIGLTSHTAFVDITNPTAPIYLGKLPTATINSIWRDIKVYANFAFIVSEASGHGMQVFDLTRLRSVVSPPLTFTTDAYYTGFGRAHNIAINEETGFAYIIGSTTFSGGPHFVNIQNPLAPVAAGGYAAEGYTHDAQIVNYSGMDVTHLGKEIFFGANEDKVVIVDVTDKTNPILLSTFTYANTAYTHQGWLTEDHKYFILGDEVDEQTFGFNTKTIIIDVSDLDNPVLKWNYAGVTPAIDHNGYVKGDEFYLANYRAGLRIMDLSSIDSSNMTEIGFFDTFPSSNSNSFNGAWSVYPYFDSGSIIISDIESGLFIVKKNAILSSDDFFEIKSQIIVYPNPAKSTVTIDTKIILFSVSIVNIDGRIVYENKDKLSNSQQIDISNLASGVYFININNTITKKLIIE